MAARYRIDPRRSRFTVQAFATGALSFFGHSPTFAVRDYAGAIRFEGGHVAGLVLELTVRADSLALEDRVGESDRREIEERMRRDVLETAAHPEIAFRAARPAVEEVARGRYQLGIGGDLSLHGVTRPIRVSAELTVFEDGVQLRCGCPLRMPDFGIRPVTALGGTIRLKDEVQVALDLAAVLEEQP
jgi:polyisoprenoid-binding protein YceI